MDRQIIESSAVLDNVTSQQAVVMYIDVYLPQLRRRCLFLLTNTRRGGDDALPYTRYRNDMECVLSRQNEPTSRNSNASRRYRLHRYTTFRVHVATPSFTKQFIHTVLTYDRRIDHLCDFADVNSIQLSYFRRNIRF